MTFRLLRCGCAYLVVAVGLLALAGPQRSFAAEQPIAVAVVQHDGPVNFEKEVLPIFKRNCIACHNVGHAENHLILETPQTILKGGDAGPAVTPKDGDNSFLLMVAAHQSDPLMPPKDNKVNAKPFTSQELGLLKLWIDQGAEGTVTGSDLTLNWQPLPPGVNPIYAVALTPDGQYAACGRANQIFICHIPSGKVVCRLTDPALLTGTPYDKPGVAHLDIVQSLAFNPQGDLLASGGYREVKVWRRPANPKFLSVAAADAGVTALAVSPDKKWLATGAEDKSIKLWDLAAGTPGPVLAGHTAAVTGLRFSADGTRLVSCSLDKTIRIWNVADGAAVGRIDAPTPVNAITLVGDGSLVASGGAENLIRLWTLPKEPIKQLAGLPNPVTAMAASPDKKWLAVAGGDGQVVLVDLATGAVTTTIKAHEGGATSVAFNLNGNRLVTGGADKAARVWDVATGQPVAAVFAGGAAVDAVAIHPGGNQIASAWGEGLIGVWKIDVPASRALNGDNAAPATVAAVSPNGQQLATDGLVDGKPAIVVRDIASGNIIRTIPGHEGPITALAFSPDGSRLASGSADNTARVWNLADGTQLARFAGHTQKVTGVAFNSNGQQVASGSADNSVKLWNVADGAELKNFAGHGGPVVAVAMTTNDQFVISASADQTVRVWNPADASQVRAIAHGTPATALALARDNARIAVGGADNAVKVYNLADGNLVYTLAGHTAAPASLAFSPDNQRLVSGGPDNQALAWELVAGKLIEALPRPAGLTFAAYGADANTILLGLGDKTIHVESLHFERRLDGNVKRITGLVYSNDGGMVITASEDGTVRGFGSGDGQQRYSANHGAAVYDLALSPDGQWLASGGEDKFVRIWNAGNGGGGPKPQFGPFETPVKSVAFSRDNQRVIGGTAGHEAAVFDLQTGLTIEGYAGHAASIEGAAAVGDQNPIWITASADSSVQVWPLLAVRQVPGHNGPITSLATIPTTPTQIISGSEDGVLRHWNMDNGSQVREYAHGGPITGVAVRPDGKRFASAGANNIAKLWNAENGQPIADMKGDLHEQALAAKATKNLQGAQNLVAARKNAQAEAEKNAPVTAEAAKKAAEALATATTAFNEKAEAARVANEAKAAADKAAVEAAAALKLAQDAQAKAKAAADAEPNNTDLAAAKVAADQVLAAAVQKSNEAAAAATAAAKPAEDASNAAKAAEMAKVMAQKASDEAALIAKKASDLVPATVALVAEAEQLVKTRETELATATAASTATEKPIRTIAFSPDNFTLATGGDDQIVHTWNADTGTPFETYQGHGGVVRALAFASERGLVSGAVDKAAIVWDLAADWTLERTIGGLMSPAFQDRVIALDFSPDGLLLATGGGEPSRSGELKIWNVADGALVRDLPEAHSDTVFGVDFSADGKFLATCAADKFVKVWDLATGNRVRSFEGHTHHVLGVSWRLDGLRLASCGADNVIKVWNLETGEQQTTIQGFGKQVTSISFIGDSPNTVSSSGDMTVRMHNVDNGQNYRTFSGATDYLYSAASTPDGKIVAAGGQDSTLRIWNGESGAILVNFEPPKLPAEPGTAQAAK